MSEIRATLALAWAYLLGTWRSKPTLFWNLLFPLFTLIGFSYIFGNGEPVPVARVVPGIMTINLLAAAFFGVSLHMVSLREQELYRRFEVTPLLALSVVGAHAVTALINILVSAAFQLAVAKALFHMPIQGSVWQILGALLLGAFAFIPLGLLVGSVARDMKSGPAIGNLLFFPLSFLSGAAMPLSFMPGWLQRVATLLPSTYVVELWQGAILRGEFGRPALTAAFILLVTGLVGFAFNAWLFRWETNQPLRLRSLGFCLATLLAVYSVPFARHIQVQTALNANEDSKQSSGLREGADTRILMGMTVFDGNGGRVDHAQIVIEGNRIVEVGPAPITAPKGIPITDLSGYYVIPGLIDSHVHLGASGGGSASRDEFSPARVVHDTQVYLAMGVTSIVSMADHVEDMQRLQRDVAGGSFRGPRPFISGPVITAPGGSPATIFSFMPGFAEYMTRQVATAEAASEAVRELAAMKVDFVKLYLDEGTPWEPLPVLSEAALRAAIQTAHELGLRTTVHVNNDAQAALAIRAGTNSVEHIPPDLSDATIDELVKNKVTLTPTLVAMEAMKNVLEGAAVKDTAALAMVEPEILSSLNSGDSPIVKLRQKPGAAAYYAERYRKACAALRRAHDKGVILLAGSDGGNAGSFHGPGLLRELELLVQEGGLTPNEAVTASTGSAAARLETSDVGRVASGAFADLVVVGADPSKDIHAIREVKMIYLGGHPFRPKTLLTTSAGGWHPLFSIPTMQK